MPPTMSPKPSPVESLTQHHPLIIEGMGGYDPRDPEPIALQMASQLRARWQDGRAERAKEVARAVDRADRGDEGAKGEAVGRVCKRRDGGDGGGSRAGRSVLLEEEARVGGVHHRAEGVGPSAGGLFLASCPWLFFLLSRA